MEIAGVVERVEHITAIRANSAADASSIHTGLVAVREVQAWCDAQHGALVAQLRTVDSFPEQRIADAARTSLGQATSATDRSDMLAATPRLADALEDGAITAGHIDAVTRATRKLKPEQRAALVDAADRLAVVATAATINEFSRRLDLETRRLQADDGVDLLERQRRNTRARTWVDHDGMWNLAAKFDPITGVKIASRLDRTVQALFAEAVPDGCPSDHQEKQHYLVAHALAQIVTDHAASTTAARSASPEFVVVIDADASGRTGPVAEFAIPVEIPARIVADLAGDADVHAVVVRNGVVLHAPGELDLGRSTRLANRAQRRALRGLYRTCAIPDCTVGYDRCKLHHIVWWRNDGTTDLHNLLPVCTSHHTKIHHADWVIEVGPNRELTLRLPDGSVRTTGPPSRRQPAA